MAIDYYERIPNNVGLADNRALQRALEQWQPRFLDWWREMGPSSFRGADVYLRTATTADDKGWASYGHIAMPEYRWGIFLADPVPDRRIGFGDALGEPVWQQVPGEHRSSLRRLIVTQGDTEPASVEQQRRLGNTCPSLYDLRNLFQVNVEEGRHLWAMVYLLHAYFGRDGREEAEELLTRHSGDGDKPQILGTFNEPITDWLSFFMFTYFTDRDGRFQLKSLAESAFDPLSRSCRFMLAEEAFHMFVGASGITQIIRRTLQMMKDLSTDDPAAVSQRRRYRSADLAALHQLLVQFVGRPVRCRNFIQCGELFCDGDQRATGRGAFPGSPRRGPPADRFARRKGRGDPGRGADARRHERDVACGLRQGLRDRRPTLEPADSGSRPRTSDSLCRVCGSGARSARGLAFIPIPEADRSPPKSGAAGNMIGCLRSRTAPSLEA